MIAMTTTMLTMTVFYTHNDYQIHSQGGERVSQIHIVSTNHFASIVLIIDIDMGMHIYLMIYIV
jgi:hypothetical protein